MLVESGGLIALLGGCGLTALLDGCLAANAACLAAVLGGAAFKVVLGVGSEEEALAAARSAATRSVGRDAPETCRSRRSASPSVSSALGVLPTGESASCDGPERTTGRAGAA